MAKALIFLQMEIHFQVFMFMVNQKESGSAKVFTQENSKME
jgi:heme/copper-type cytochrome/quinol oxidase subunit 4